MSTPRLINETRERIQKALLIRRFRKLINEVTEKRAHLINQVYLDLYTPEIRRKMAELPKGWLPEETGLDVRFGSSGTGYVRILFTGTFHGFLQRYADYKKEVVCHRIQQRHKGICVKSYEDTHLFSIRFQELEDERNKLEGNGPGSRTHLNADAPEYQLLHQADRALAGDRTLCTAVYDRPEAHPAAGCSDPSAQQAARLASLTEAVMNHHPVDQLPKLTPFEYRILQEVDGQKDPTPWGFIDRCGARISQGLGPHHQEIRRPAYREGQGGFWLSGRPVRVRPTSLPRASSSSSPTPTTAVKSAPDG